MMLRFTSLRRLTQAAVISGALALVLAGCGTSAESDNETGKPAQTVGSESTPSRDTPAESAEAQVQEETCDWESPKVSGAAEAPAGQDGELSEVIVGAWQHTHTDEGNGFESTTNDHRYVFPSPDRMLYCQHIPGATDHDQNAADIVLNGTTIELPGGKYSYTVTAWDEDTLVWDNPVGGGYVYLLQRR